MIIAVMSLAFMTLIPVCGIIGELMKSRKLKEQMRKI